MKEANNMDMAYSVIEMLAEATDSQFGKGCSEYVANEILKYYGV